MKPPTAGEVIDYLMLREYPSPLIPVFSVGPDADDLTMHINACCVLKSRDLDLARPIDPQVDGLVAEVLDVFLKSHEKSVTVMTVSPARDFLEAMLKGQSTSPVGPAGEKSLMAYQEQLEATIRRLKGGRP